MLEESKVQQEQRQFITEAIEEGTEPISRNFAEFTLLALHARNKIDTLQFIFPPYQVAPYVYGTQEIEIPSKVFFDLIHPVYKSMFAIH
ncbi:hypothetical protein NURINAE_01703 [Candidatus Nitrosacidococcus sp. I8]|nr:hypothetical protein NURINAE_01703 [Candidatus Nitrosacidococcus sp. I8]